MFPEIRLIVTQCVCVFVCLDICVFVCLDICLLLFLIQGEFYVCTKASLHEWTCNGGKAVCIFSLRVKKKI